MRKVAKTTGDVPDQITHRWICEVKNNEMKIQDEKIAEAGYFSKADMKNLSLWPAN